MLESQDELLECSNTGQDQVLESYANSLLLEWYPGTLAETPCEIRVPRRISVGSLALMPSLLTWDYTGVQKEEHRRQRAHAKESRELART